MQIHCPFPRRRPGMDAHPLPTARATRAGSHKSLCAHVLDGFDAVDEGSDPASVAPAAGAVDPRPCPSSWKRGFSHGHRATAALRLFLDKYM